MTEQLSLSPVRAAVRAAGTGRRAADHRLDDRTKQIGLKGVAAARAALAAANQRVSERMALAEAQREAELVRRAKDATRKAA